MEPPAHTTTSGTAAMAGPAPPSTCSGAHSLRVHAWGVLLFFMQFHLIWKKRKHYSNAISVL